MGKNKPETLEAALEHISDLQKANAQLSADLKEKDAIIADIRKVGTKGMKWPRFKKGSDTYEVRAKSTRVNGKNVTAEEICNSKELQAELIEMGAGFLVKLK